MFVGREDHCATTARDEIGSVACELVAEKQRAKEPGDNNDAKYSAGGRVATSGAAEQIRMVADETKPAHWQQNDLHVGAG